MTYSPGSAAQPLDFVDAVHQLSALIPSGKVLSYGDIAELLGAGGPRQVGKAMQFSAQQIPWWRVIRSDGLIADPLYEQAMSHWLAENMPLRGRKVDMTRARWQPDSRQWEALEDLAQRLETTKMSEKNDGMGS